MKIVRINKLPDDIVEVEYDTGLRSQIRVADLLLMGSESPADFKAEVRELYSSDFGLGSESSVRTEK